jgi:hypothetical protein
MKAGKKRQAAKPRADNPSPALKRSQKIARGLLIAMAVLALPMSSIYIREPFWPGIVVLAATPWLALLTVRLFGDLFAIDDFGNSKQRADLAPVVLGPGLGLIGHAIVTLNLIGWTWVAVYGVASGTVMAGAVALASPAVRKSAALVGFAVFMSFYGGALAAFANVWFDGAAPQVVARSILDKRSRSLGKYTAVHWATVAPWGPYTETDEVEVSREFDEAHKVGEAVCIYLHPGALGIAWHTAGECGAVR